MSDKTWCVKRFLCALAIFTVFSLPAASARALTREEALSWIRDQEGMDWDLDGRYGAQCSDLATAYLNYLLTSDPQNPIFGVYDGFYYAQAAAQLPEYFEILSPFSSPMPGDLFVSEGADEHGHVGLILDPREGGALILDQNSRNGNYVTGSPAWLHLITWEGGYRLQALIRFKGFEEIFVENVFLEDYLPDAAVYEEAFVAETISENKGLSEEFQAFSSLVLVKNQGGKLTFQVQNPYPKGRTEVRLYEPSLAGDAPLHQKRSKKERFSLSGLCPGKTYVLTWRFYVKKNTTRFYGPEEGRLLVTVQ